MKKSRKLLIIIAIVTLIRFLISYNLPSFYIKNLIYDDRLMIHQLTELLNGNYIDSLYRDYTLVKGIAFPLLLYIIKTINLSYSSAFTILYILSCMYFTKSLDKVLKNKKTLLLIYIVLLFNPISFSSELFQRLYRNSFSSIQLLLFLGVTIRLFLSDNKIKKDIINYVLLGIIISIMYVTREDNIWTILIIILLVFYKLIKTKSYKLMLLGIIPFVILHLNLNIISLINYKYYGIYTYNEIQKSNFKIAYSKILQIKDDKEIDKVSIPKTTFYKLIDLTETFNIPKEKLDIYYMLLSDKNGEIYNGNIIWYFKQIVHKENEFKNGKEEEKYYKKLSNEIDSLFKEKKLEKEFIFPSILINRPTKNAIKKLPKSIIDIIAYTTTYKNIKTITDVNKFKYNSKVNAYSIVHIDSHTTENIIKENDKDYEMIRIIYMILSTILSPISLVIYVMNIKKKDNINLISNILLISYLIIIAGVSYTNVTAFPAKRYLYLGNIYILQSIFIYLNMYRIVEKEEKRL